MLWLAAAVTAMLSLAAAGCGSDEGDTGSGTGGGSGEDIILGGVWAKSGFMEFFDAPVKDGVEAAIEEVNAGGGIGGQQIKLITADYKSEAALAQTATQQVIDEGAEIILTPNVYDFGGPSARVANGAGKVAFGAVGDSRFGVQGTGPLTYNTFPGSATEGSIAAEWLHANGFEKPFLLLDTTTTYTEALCESADERFRELAGEDSIAGSNTFKNTDPEISAQVRAIQRSGADSIVLCSYPPGGASAVLQVRDAGIDLPIISGGGGMDGDYWLEAVPNLSEFYTTAEGSLYGDSPVAERNELFDTIERMQGERPKIGGNAIDGYAMIELLERALTETDGDTDGAKLAEKLNAFTDVPTLAGPMTFTPECHTVYGRPAEIVKITNGKPAYLETFTPEKVVGPGVC